MPTFTSFNFSKELECAICLEAWNNPVELIPCKHIYCSACVSTVRVCPECRRQITGHGTPNRVLVNLANEVSVRCNQCEWVGTRDESKNHRCGTRGRTQSLNAPQWPSSAEHAVSISHPAPDACPEIIPVPENEPWRAYGISQVEYDQIFAIFLQFDTDNSGELDFQELKRLARWLNFAHTDHDIATMFQQMDRDHSGTLSMAEFCTWLKFNRPNPQALYGMSQLDYNYVLMQFHQFDEDHSGELDKRQFVKLCLNLGYARNPREAEAVFDRIDLDHSGRIDLHEFLTYRSQALASQVPSPYSGWQSQSASYPPQNSPGYPPTQSHSQSANYPPQQGYPNYNVPAPGQQGGYYTGYPPSHGYR